MKLSTNEHGDMVANTYLVTNRNKQASEMPLNTSDKERHSKGLKELMTKMGIV